MALTIKQVQERVRRLEELTRGLPKELAAWKKGDDPLLYLERKAYLNGIQDALDGIETARVTLASVCQRLDVDDNGAEGNGGVA
jgi:hypothetical protein